ncbi:MAG: serine/threonine-protein phosphatase, partial [Gemmatimonadetes bacterium]|nr:serine/threonine-protein phosphatase [Gemmatimonadota bacterium]
ACPLGAALVTHGVVREGLRQARVVRAHALAHDLQMKLLPSSSKLEGTAQVAARCLPAEAVGGDFYNLFPLSGERLGILIGDVSSHGFPAALIMALTMSAIAIYAQEGGPPGDVLRRVHYALIQELENTEMSLALFYAVLDPAGGRLRYANAGHPHAFRIPATGAAERLGAGNPPLGTQLYAHYGEREVPWVRGQDLLCLFTDGLSDALATDGTPTGEARLLEEVLKLRERAPAEVLEHVYALAASQRADIPADDRTAVLVRA